MEVLYWNVPEEIRVKPQSEEPASRRPGQGTNAASPIAARIPRSVDESERVAFQVVTYTCCD